MKKSTSLNSKQILPQILHTCNVFEPSPISQLLIEMHRPLNGCSTQSVKFRNDVFLLFNQKRLDRMSLERFSQYLDEIATPSSGLSSLRNKVDDSTLHRFVKSRYIQSASELQAWSAYLTSQADIVEGDIKTYLESVSRETDNPQDNNDTPPAE